jgi:hypothetical protein
MKGQTAMRNPTHSRQLLAGLVVAGLLVATVTAMGQEARDMHEIMQSPARSEGYRLFTGFWWLLFPLGWAIGALVRNFLRHARAKEALQVLKSYADQGKEPPAELIAVLRQPDQPRLRSDHYGRYGWIPVFLFGALTLGFLLMAVFPPDKGIPVAIMPFIALIMAGLCVGNLVAMRAYQNRDRAPPP